MRNLSVTEWAQFVHDSGQPISHAAWLGLYCPPACQLSRAASTALMHVCWCGFIFRRPGCSQLTTVSVGNDPDALAFVRRAGVASAQHSPSRIIPQRGQITEHGSKPPKSESWAVLHEHESRSHFAHDSPHFSPESRSLAVEPIAGSGWANVLAREAARHDIHQTAPWSSVEGSHIVPDGEWFEASIVLSGEEHAACVCVDFDSADRAPPEELAPEYAASSACE